MQPRKRVKFGAGVYRTRGKCYTLGHLAREVYSAVWSRHGYLIGHGLAGPALRLSRSLADRSAYVRQIRPQPLEVGVEGECLVAQAIKRARQGPEDPHSLRYDSNRSIICSTVTLRIRGTSKVRSLADDRMLAAVPCLYKM